MGQRHHGEFLKWLVDTYKPVINDLADHIGLDRSYIYKLYDEPKIKWEYLRLAAEFVNYDITRDFPDIPIPRKQFVEESSAIYGSMSLSECLRVNQELTQKLIRLQDRLIDSQDDNKRLTEENKKLSNKKHKKNENSTNGT